MTYESICKNKLCPVFNYFVDTKAGGEIGCCPSCHQGEWYDPTSRKVKTWVPPELRRPSYTSEDSLTKGEHARRVAKATRSREINPPRTHPESVGRVVKVHWRRQK